VGDDDQAIYGWRGARVKNILEFPQVFHPCEVIQLDRNYRSSGPILNLANHVISNNKDRHGKVLKAQAYADKTDKPEVFVFQNDEEEVEQVAKLMDDFKSQGYTYSDMAVLYRSNGQGGFLETELRQSRIPYTISGGTAFFDRREVKDMLSYLICLFMPKEVSLRRIINVPQRGVGDETVKKIEDYVLSRKAEMTFVQGLRLSKHFDFLSQGSRNGVQKFLDDLKILKADFLSVDDIDWEQRLVRYFHEIGYRQYLSKFCKNDEALKRRWMAVEIFARVFSNFMKKHEDKRKGLKEFLDMMMLRDFEDEMEEQNKDQVQLMTMHAAKGLEFPVDFIIGVEEDIIPHHKLGSDTAEERRLFYVGVTRAKERLVMSYAKERKRYGKMREVAPSRFLLEISNDLYSHHTSGFRPMNEQSRDLLLSQLQAQLSQSMEKQKIEST
ncbi:MAG: ATP-binding domain-containing protein, partial [Bdellovibrionales bacterium]|nr:ATP-binding domain-containing protein [Bdellovibrionales bacterium]